jgi:hypothetical protein
MKKMIVIGSVAVLSAALAGAQTTQTSTKETKVGVSLKGIEVTRKRSHTTKTQGRAMRDVRATNIRVLVDGTPVRFVDQGPVMRGSRVLVPLRGVFERLGANVVWDRATNTVNATRGERMVKLPLNGTTATVGGQTITLDEPAMVLNGRALVPLRFLGESLGATVDWRAADLTVTIKSGA